MAYENQIKCNRCGKSILPMPEDASPEELLCDGCYESEQVKAAYENSECPDCGEAIPVHVKEGEACRNCGHVFWSDHTKENSDYCPKCGCHWITHNDDGSCVDNKEAE